MLYAYITGGGTKWIYDSLKKGGASKWFLGARVPYNQKDFIEVLGGEPFDGKYVSKRTASQLAAAAYNHTFNLTGDENSIGLGVTAKLGTKGQRKDRDNKIVICLMKQVDGYLRSYTREHSYVNWYPRILQEVLSSYHIEKLVKGKTQCEIHDSSGYIHLSDLKAREDRKSIIVYSGSFNPIHESHKAIIENVKGLFKGYGDFALDISSRNFSKGCISPLEMDYRDYQVFHNSGMRNIVFSRESTFLEKARVLKANGYTNTIFPMGDDTYDRITDIERDELNIMGVKLLVFRRLKDELIDDHSIIHRESFKLPKLKNISSTEIRKQNAI